METCPSEKKCDPPCARQVALFQVDPLKLVRPALHWPGSKKSSKYIEKSWRKAGRTHLGSWSYSEPIWTSIFFCILAKSETLLHTMLSVCVCGWQMVPRKCRMYKLKRYRLFCWYVRLVWRKWCSLPNEFTSLPNRAFGGPCVEVLDLQAGITGNSLHWTHQAV